MLEGEEAWPLPKSLLSTEPQIRQRTGGAGLQAEGFNIIIPLGETYEIKGTLRASDDVTIAFEDSSDDIPYFSINAWNYFEVYDKNGTLINPWTGKIS